ncbi:ATP-grasp fold amidoligase family protein [Bacillus cereus]|uniref:ATP-grasp fold amidoligase family protein n=1 Tax=Bacillus cereus group TaxID=86661 RepID=UPI0001A01144|nr:ATP-grasp fold amidoligase family protein [Bacillus cereus]EEK76122.1 Glycosyltransferase [Bacillus cereus R309803]HDR4562311.1 glycosyl transferase [Bacillus luti]
MEKDNVDSRLKGWLNIQFDRFDRKGLLNALSDSLYLKIRFWIKMDYKLNLKYPTTFNEKLQFLKLHDRNPKYTKMVDKYEVREYIEEILGEEYLIPIIGVYDRFEDIDFEELPDQFVLKCTHDSGGLVICKDKSQLDITRAKNKINKCLETNYYYRGREFPYKNVRPRIICEEYMVDESGTELKDYKFMCFNGEVKSVFVCLNRNSSKGLNIDFYDPDWNLLPFTRQYPNSGISVPKPKSFDQMIVCAEKLSKDIPFIRVDFYEINGKMYFGELTLYPASGFSAFKPEKYDSLLGSWIQLPRV